MRVCVCVCVCACVTRIRLRSCARFKINVREAMMESWRKRCPMIDLAILATRGLSGWPRQRLASSKRHCNTAVLNIPLSLSSGLGCSKPMAHVLAS